MSQLNIYVPDDLEVLIKEKAQAQGKSVSSFVIEAIRERIAPGKWSPEFLAMLESEPTDFPEVEDLPLQKRKYFK